eukprot:3178703-Pleurochrysis_carterae.AAC.1
MADETNEDDENMEAHPADKEDAGNTAADRVDKMANNDKDDEAQEEQGQGQELDSTSSREAIMPKSIASDQAKVRSPMRHTLQIRTVMIVIMHMLLSNPHHLGTICSFTRPISDNTKQRANRTRFELAPTQTNLHKTLVLGEQTVLPSLNTCYSQVFKIETSSKDRPRAKFFNTTMILNGICVQLGLSDNAVADTRGFATHGDPRMGTLNVVIPPHNWERLEVALSKDGAGFAFRSILPKDAECADRTPVTFYAQKTSNNTIMRGSQKNPK